MKETFCYDDLKEEYKEAFLNYKENYIKAHPYCDVAEATEYAKHKTLKLARKLYNPSIIAHLIEKNAPIEEILKCHVSCAERINCNRFLHSINDILLHVDKVLDIGCGLNPALLVSRLAGIKYFCYDKDACILGFLQLLNEKYLNNRLTILSQNCWENTSAINALNPDLVLAQKVIPTLFYSRNIHEMDKIAGIHARLILISGCVNSLSRNVSIKDKEASALEWFISRYGFRKVRYLEDENEIGWILDKEKYEYIF